MSVLMLFLILYLAIGLIVALEKLGSSKVPKKAINRCLLFVIILLFWLPLGLYEVLHKVE